MTTLSIMGPKKLQHEALTLLFLILVLWQSLTQGHTLLL